MLMDKVLLSDKEVLASHSGFTVNRERESET